MGTINCIVTRN